MARNKKALWEFEPGEIFTIAGKKYSYVGRYNTGFRFRCFAIDEFSHEIKEFSGDTEFYIKTKKKRDDFWYKKKFMELVRCGSIEHHKVNGSFDLICSRLFSAIHRGHDILEKLGGEYCRDDYIITVDHKYWDGTVIMLINTVNGKSVACKHINPERVTIDNVYAILVDLYKKYMNQ